MLSLLAGFERLMDLIQQVTFCMVFSYLSRPVSMPRQCLLVRLEMCCVVLCCVVFCSVVALRCVMLCFLALSCVLSFLVLYCDVLCCVVLSCRVLNVFAHFFLFFFFFPSCLASSLLVLLESCLLFIVLSAPVFCFLIVWVGSVYPKKACRSGSGSTLFKTE